MPGCPPLKPVQPFNQNHAVISIASACQALTISVFSADSQTTKLVGADWPVVSLAYCLSAVFVVAPVSPYSPRQTLVLLPCWKSACLGIIGSCCILSGSPVFINVFIKGVD